MPSASHDTDAIANGVTWPNMSYLILIVLRAHWVDTIVLLRGWSSKGCLSVTLVKTLLTTFTVQELFELVELFFERWSCKGQLWVILRKPPHICSGFLGDGALSSYKSCSVPWWHWGSDSWACSLFRSPGRHLWVNMIILVEKWSWKGCLLVHLVKPQLCTFIVQVSLGTRALSHFPGKQSCEVNVNWLKWCAFVAYIWADQHVITHIWCYKWVCALSCEGRAVCVFCMWFCLCPATRQLWAILLRDRASHWWYF